MANPANSTVQNLLPVQAYFNVDGSFNTFIGQGVPFYATANPQQSGLSITNSTINSTTIGASVPSTAVFSSGQVNATPVGSTDIVNKQYVDSVAAGLSWKQPVAIATLVNITLSGLQVIDGYTTLAGDRVLVKNQSTAANNGIYIAASGAWSRSADADTWNELVGAITFIEYGTQASSAFYCSAQPGGTLGVTAVNWSIFSVSAVYTAGTGLTLTGYEFKITNTGVTAATYGSASAVPVIAVNAQGQITLATTTTIAIANTQVSGLGTMSTQNANLVTITGGTLNGVTIGGTTAGAVTATTFTGAGTGLTGTATSLSIGGTAALATSLAGGAAGSLPYQSGANATTFLAAATNGQVLTLAAGVPSWATPTTGTVTSVSGTGTVNGITLTGTVTSSGSITLGGTLGSIANSQLTNSSITFGATAAALGTTVSGFNAVTIGATTASTGAFTYLSTSSSISTTPVLSFNASNCNLALGGTIASTYLQAVMQNKSATAGASTNWAVSNNLGTDSTYYGEFGMNSSIFSASTPVDFFSINNGIYFSSHDGDVTVGSGNGFKTYLAWGTLGQSAHVINATGAIGLNTNLGTTPALSGTTNFGTSGQVLTSAGSAATPTWTTPFAGLTITDDTSTNATRYLTFTSATSGTITTANTSSTKLAFNPSTGFLGIGTASPSANIQISSATAKIRIGQDASSAYLDIYRDAPTGASVYNAAQTSFGFHVWQTASTERMRLDASGNLGIGTTTTTGAQLTVAGSSSISALKVPNIVEPTTVSATAATGTINYDVTTQSVLYYTTSASANWTVNFRGSSGTSLNTLMAVNDTIAVTFMVTQGATAYYNNALTIDGTSVTPKWAGGTAPTSGNASGIDIYNYVITKTASATYTVLASITQFK